MSAQRAQASEYQSPGTGLEKHTWDQDEDSKLESLSERDSAAPKAPQLPSFMVEKQTKFDTTLPALPKNAEAMAALKAKLMAQLGG